MPDDATMTFRLPADLRAAFLAACKAADRSAAQELRAFMRSYVQSRAQGVLPLAEGSPVKRGPGK